MKVEVAVPVTERPVVWRPPVNVEVPAVVLPAMIGPWKVEVAPFPNIVVVAVRPTYIPSIDERRVEEANPLKS